MDDRHNNSSVSSSYLPDFIEIIDAPYSIDHIVPMKSCSMKLKVHSWLKVILFLNLASIVLSASAIITPRWVEQGDDSTFWRGNLMKCGGCSGLFSNKSYNEISEYSCHSMEGYCRTFSRLYRAGVAMLLIECIYFLMSLMWNVIIICDLVYIRKNIRFIAIAIMVTPAVQAIGLAAWFGFSKAKLVDNCYYSASNMSQDQLVCATHGPILVIVSIAISCISCSLYFWVKKYENKLIKNKIKPSIN